jgi:hypothetical protein
MSTTPVGGNTSVIATFLESIDASNNVQLLFMKLQLAMAEQCRGKATNLMDTLENDPKEYKLIDKILKYGKDEVARYALEERWLEAFNDVTDRNGIMSPTAVKYYVYEAAGKRYDNAPLSTNDLEKVLAKVKADIARLDNLTKTDDKYLKEKAGLELLEGRAQTMLNWQKSNLDGLDQEYLGLTGKPLPSDIRDYLDSMVAPRSTGGFVDKFDWAIHMPALESRQKELNVDTDTLQAEIKDAVAQYNAFLQGGKSVLDQMNATMTGMAKF